MSSSIIRVERDGDCLRFDRQFESQRGNSLRTYRVYVHAETQKYPVAIDVLVPDELEMESCPVGEVELDLADFLRFEQGRIDLAGFELGRAIVRKLRGF